MYYQGIGQVNEAELAEIKEGDLQDHLWEKEREEKERQDACDLVVQLGSLLKEEGANPELIQAFRSLYKEIKKEGPYGAKMSFRGKKISFEGTVIPSLRRRGIEVAW